MNVVKQITDNINDISVIRKLITDKFFNMGNYITLISSLKFDKNRNQWLIYNENTPQDEYPKKEITYMTYNVWFGNENFNNRIKAICQLIEFYSPDYICLQEVTSNFLNFIMEKQFIRDNYYISNNYKGSYDVLMLTKTYSTFYKVNFSSNMGRNLLLTEVFLPNSNKTGKLDNLLISTSHLESLNNPHYRKNQLESSFEILNKSNYAFMMGDFNFDETCSMWKNEDGNIDPKYINPWHQWKKANNLKAIAGEWDIQEYPQMKLLKTQERDVEIVKKHEDYRRDSLQNDIALLFLNTPFELNYHIDIICLPPADLEFVESHCTVTGWGKIYNILDLNL